jgi:flagellin-like protein
MIVDEEVKGGKMAKKVAKSAVSPVLATLMMVAVAVALSVIIFTWSQGFLSQTGEAASGQQAAQNIAAQSGILIESATFSGVGGASPTATVYVRNVGTTTVTVDSAQMVIRSGASSRIEIPSLTSTSISPRESESITLSNFGSLSSGDVVTIKLITTVGTFAQATFMVP